MLLDAFEHAEDDAAARLLIEAKNEAEAVLAATEKTLASTELAEMVGTELDATELKRIESVVAAVKMVLKSSDREAIQNWTRALNNATQHLAEVMLNRSVQAALSGKSIDQL
jgi:molecular chaperone DnaK (HSP70)